MEKSQLIKKIGELVDSSILQYYISEISGNGSPSYYAQKAKELPIELALQEVKNDLLNDKLEYTPEIALEVEDMINSLNQIRNLNLGEISRNPIKR